MSELFEHLREVTRDLDDLQCSYALVGGLAVSLRTEPRFTRDMDIAVAVESDDEAEQIGKALLERDYRVVAQVEHESADRLATLRLTPPNSSGLIVDLLFASCGIEPEIVNSAEPIEALPGWTTPVALPEHLLVMKILASDPPRRMKDLIDARALLNSMSNREVEKSRLSMALIEKRGFNRKKDLANELAQFIVQCE